MSKQIRFTEEEWTKLNNKSPQTAVEWLYNICKQKEPDKFDFEQAKQMEKEQVFEFWQGGINCTEEGGKSFEQYYNETYGSEGNGEHKGIAAHSSSNDNMPKTHTIIQGEILSDNCPKSLNSSDTAFQTEISDEEIEKAALSNSDNIQQHIGWDKAITWYREQLKQRQ